ncbi:nitric oxide associated protein 1, partial [Turnera subulata]
MAMAPKTLSCSSMFVSPLTLHHLSHLNTKLLPLLLSIHHHQHARARPSTSLLVCKSTRTPAEAQGSLGEQFSEQHHKALEAEAAAAANMVVMKQKSPRKKAKRRPPPPKPFNLAACCYGCGAPLQTSENDAPGYVDPHTYELKKRHHQLRTVLCRRCHLLSHGHMITAVGGNGGYSSPGGKQFVLADELRHNLSHLRHHKALIVKLVDIVDFNGSFLARVRDLAGPNPIILVVTKVDLLPRDTDLNCVGDWVVEATAKKKLNVLSVHLTSSKSLVGIAGVASEIQKEKKGRDVYILMFLTHCLYFVTLEMMAQRDPAAAAARKYKPIQSAVPGTTLGPIQIDAFLGGGKLFDTPGVHLHHRQAAVVHSEDLPALAPRSRLKGQSFPNATVASESSLQEKLESTGLNGFSIFWGGLARIDILKVLSANPVNLKLPDLVKHIPGHGFNILQLLVPFQVLPQTRLTFYGPKALKIHLVPTDKAEEFYLKELGELLTPPTGKERANNWRGLEIERQLRIKFEEPERPVSDVAISGLGWIAIEAVSRSLEKSNLKLEQTTNELHLAVHVPRPVEIFVRPPLPVGKAGAAWYQYRELSEKEEQLRPKWHF